MRLNEELIESHTIYRGRVVTLRIDTVRLPNGNTARREIVEHRGAVAIVPLLAQRGGDCAALAGVHAGDGRD